MDRTEIEGVPPEGVFRRKMIVAGIDGVKYVALSPDIENDEVDLFIEGPWSEESKKLIDNAFNKLMDQLEDGDVTPEVLYNRLVMVANTCYHKEGNN